MASYHVDQPAEVASKVMRRVQVAKMTRALQSRLALANVKVKNGWENLDLDTLEPHIEQELKRKRPTSSSDPSSDTSSTSSARFVSRGLESSPLTAPLFSDDFPRSGSIYGTRRRGKYQPSQGRQATSSNHNRVRTTGRNGIRITSWKSSYELPQSSPIKPAQRHVSLMSSASKRQRHPSFMMSDAPSTHADEENMQSEEDDEDLPTLAMKQPKFQRPSPHHHRIPPPRTPSPDPIRRTRSRPFNTQHNNAATHNQEGADLLMFLATSPSPANPRTIRQTHHNASTTVPPSTPPSRTTPLPSSMMHTPGNSANGGFLPGFISTPGNNFNFSDYLNVTPSPAQAAWRTPGVGRTPLGRTSKRLNFDGLLPPSPNLIGDRGADARGLGMMDMELGGELSQME